MVGYKILPTAFFTRAIITDNLGEQTSQTENALWKALLSTDPLTSADIQD